MTHRRQRLTVPDAGRSTSFARGRSTSAHGAGHRGDSTRRVLMDSASSTNSMRVSGEAS